MSRQIIVGKGREIRNVPDDEFVNAVNHLPERMAERLAFMSRDHHAVRDFVVREMPRQRRPLSPRQIANVTGIDFPRVSAILSELEKHLFFLVRNSDGEVNWAFPVTTDPTSHRLSFSSGENIFGA
jgi:CRP-like cAMP-binding protein